MSAAPGSDRPGPAPAGALRIGTGGVPATARPRVSTVGVRRIRELGLSSMELEFVNGVRMGEESACQLAVEARRHDVALTVHGPYYVNLNSREERIREASVERLFQTARIGALCGASSFTFHPAFYHDDAHSSVYRKVRAALRALRRRLDGEGINIDIRPETTGKPSQFGTLEEILRLSQEIPGVYPCVDFSHMHARNGGGLNGYDSFCATLEAVQTALGPVALKRLHMHVSGIEYGPSGEKRHVPLPQADFLYEELMRALREWKVEGWVVCESPVMEEDALLLQAAYARAGDGRRPPGAQAKTGVQAKVVVRGRASGRR